MSFVLFSTVNLRCLLFPAILRHPSRHRWCAFKGHCERRCYIGMETNWNKHWMCDNWAAPGIIFVNRRPARLPSFITRNDIRWHWITNLFLPLINATSRVGAKVKYLLDFPIKRRMPRTGVCFPLTTFKTPLRLSIVLRYNWQLIDTVETTVAYRWSSTIDWSFFAAN